MAEFHLYLEYRHGIPGEPINMKAKLGWVFLFGAKGCYKHTLINKLYASHTKAFSNLVENCGQVESYSTEMPLDPKLLSKDEQRALETLQQNTIKKRVNTKLISCGKIITLFFQTTAAP